MSLVSDVIVKMTSGKEYLLKNVKIQNGSAILCLDHAIFLQETTVLGDGIKALIAIDLGNKKLKSDGFVELW